MAPHGRRASSQPALNIEEETQAFIGRLVSAVYLIGAPLADLRFDTGSPTRFHYLDLKEAANAELKTAVCVTESKLPAKTRPEASKRQLLRAHRAYVPKASSDRK